MVEKIMIPDFDILKGRNRNTDDFLVRIDKQEGIQNKGKLLDCFVEKLLYHEVGDRFEGISDSIRFIRNFS